MRPPSGRCGRRRWRSRPLANEIVIGRVFADAKKRAALPGILARDPGLAAGRDRARELRVRAGPRRRALRAARRIGPGLASTEELLGEIVFAAAPGSARRRDPRLAVPLGLNPPALDDPAAPSPARLHRFRSIDNQRRRLPNWWPGNDDPLVYVSFSGSVAGGLDFLFPRVYQVALEQLAELPARVLVTIGNEREPLEPGPQPANVRVERWVPQADVAARAAAMVVHGG